MNLVPAQAAAAWLSLADAIEGQPAPVPCTTDPDAWFAQVSLPRGQAALEACTACPVLTPCLRYALTADEEWGIWGGTTPEQRLHLLEHRDQAA